LIVGSGPGDYRVSGREWVGKCKTIAADSLDYHVTI